VKNIFAESYAERILSVGGDATPTTKENVEAGVQSSNLVSPQIAWTNIAYNFQSISLSSSIQLSIIIHPSINYHPPIIAILFLILRGRGKRGS